jgi:arylsulfatase A-like enzyme
MHPIDMLYWRFWNQTAVRKGKWKYLQAGGDRKYLFDLSSPAHETKNLIHDHPEKTAELQAALKVWAAKQKTPGVPDGQLNGQEVNFYNHFFGPQGGKAE